MRSSMQLLHARDTDAVRAELSNCSAVIRLRLAFSGWGRSFQRCRRAWEKREGGPEAQEVAVGYQTSKTLSKARHLEVLGLRLQCL